MQPVDFSIPSTCYNAVEEKIICIGTKNGVRRKLQILFHSRGSGM
jgi:hypothetical protein